MSSLENIRVAIEPSIEHMGYELVRLKWMGGNADRILQLMIEPKTGETTTVEDCEKVSTQVAALLDVEDIIKEAYRLEVSSPGIDRPLTRLKDFENYAGFECKIELNEPIKDRRRFKGRVLGVEGELIDFEVKDDLSRLKLQFSSVSEAKLVLTDELIDYETKKGQV